MLDIGIGRFPVRTAAEAKATVDKTSLIWKISMQDRGNIPSAMWAMTGMAVCTCPNLKSWQVIQNGIILPSLG